MEKSSLPSSNASAMCGAELSQALAEFKSALRERKSQHATLSQQQRKRNTMYHVKTTRPVLSSAVQEDCAHKAAFDTYLRSGSDDQLRAMDFEGKSMNSISMGDGGYLLDPQTSQTVQAALMGASSLRNVSSVVNVDAAKYEVLVENESLGSAWNAETDPVVDTTTPKIDRISIGLHELSASPKVSQRLLDDVAFDLEAWLAGRIADRFAQAESAAFVSGDGNNKPQGIMNYDQAENADWQWGKLGYVTSGSVGTIASADPLINLVYALGAQYRANATFVMNSRTASAMRSLKDNDGRFLWGDSLAAAEPARLLGYPVLVVEDMPDMEDGAAAIAFGDFSKGYTIAERPDLRILRDPFSAKPNVIFYATKRVGGGVTDFAAIKLMKFSA